MSALSLVAPPREFFFGRRAPGGRTLNPTFGSLSSLPSQQQASRLARLARPLLHVIGTAGLSCHGGLSG